MNRIHARESRKKLVKLVHLSCLLMYCTDAAVLVSPKCTRCCHLTQGHFTIQQYMNIHVKPLADVTVSFIFVI